MIVVTLFCVVGGGYVAHEAKIVRDRRAFLMDHAYILKDTWQVTQPTRAPLMLRLLGEESVFLVTVNGPADAHRATDLFPEAIVQDIEALRRY